MFLFSREEEGPQNEGLGDHVVVVHFCWHLCRVEAEDVPIVGKAGA